MKPIKVTVGGCNTFMCYLKHEADLEIEKMRKELDLLRQRDKK